MPLLVIGMLLAMSSSASAARVACGSQISADTTLTSDVGPCKGNGVTLKSRDRITLNLNGYKIYATQNGPAENYGIRLDGTTRATVRGCSPTSVAPTPNPVDTCVDGSSAYGEVSGFDAGINVKGGLGNTVKYVNVHDNVNDNIATNNAKQDCAYGDGIIAEDSDNNLITTNTVNDNGPYDGITLVGDSDGNNVTTNTVADNNIPNEDAAPGFQGNGSCGSPFSRPVQDIGIRVEGPGATDNTVQKNTVTNSAIGGITIHGYVYNPPSGTPEQPNSGNLITSNTVRDTGKDTYTVDALADGIGVLRQGPSNTVGVSQGNTIQYNTVERSYRHGISVGNPTQAGAVAGNTVRYNTVTDSRNDGIRVALGAVNNTLTGNTASNSDQGGGPVNYDGFDGNLTPPCDNNTWSGNVFGTANQTCVLAP